VYVATDASSNHRHGLRAAASASTRLDSATVQCVALAAALNHLSER